MESKYRKRRIILPIIGLILMVIITFLFVKQQRYLKAERESTYQLTEDETQLLQEGDIIFRHGYGIISDAIVKYAKENYPISHCGIVVLDSLGELAVIHTVSNTLANIDGMQLDKLDKFIRESQVNSVIVSRYHSLDSTLSTRIAEHAKYYLSRQIPFDNNFDCEDSTKFFCTEFVWRVFNEVAEVDLYKLLSSQRVDCMNFAAFLHPARFSILINHCESQPIE